MTKSNARKSRREARLEESKERKIPTEEDFARAEALMRERDRNLSIVSDRVSERFREIWPAFYGFYVLWQGTPNFRAYFFVEGRNTVTEFEASSQFTELQELVLSELERAGRGRREEISVEFEVQHRSMYLRK